MKHGNYGATSVSGASNVMEQHGVKFTSDVDQLRRSMEKCNLAYLHAPLFNPALKAVAPVRKGLAVRTFFNMLGPLVNPVLPAYQLARSLQSTVTSPLHLYLSGKQDKLCRCS